MAYTNQENVEQYLKRSLTDQESALFPLLADSADSMITRLTSKIYEMPPAPTSRFYDVMSMNFLATEDFIADKSTDITVNFVDVYANIIFTADPKYYFVQPYNFAPKNGIFFATFGYFAFPHGIQVIANWATTTEPPADVVLCSTVFISQLIDNPLGLASRSVEGYSEHMNRNQNQNPYVELLLAGIGTKIFI